MAVDYFDRLAETSVKDAIQKLAADGKRPTGKTVPPEAQYLVRQKTRGRLTESDADKRVLNAIERLKERKEIKAPAAPTSEWALIGRAGQADESSGRG